MGRQSLSPEGGGAHGEGGNPPGGHKCLSRRKAARRKGLPAEGGRSSCHPWGTGNLANLEEELSLRLDQPIGTIPTEMKNNA